jgi:hypothetical protein
VTIQRLTPLFTTLREAGLETDAEFDVQKEHELQLVRVKTVARIVGEGG